MVNLNIDNIDVSVPDGTTILDAARKAGIYIPVLCSHPDLPSFHHVELAEFIYQGNVKLVNDNGASMDDIRGCGICLVFDMKAEKPIPSCSAAAENGMRISTNSDFILKKRQENLMKVFANHPHSCLTCAQREGCIPMSDTCPGSVLFSERCCAMLGRCELQKIADYVGIASETQRYQFKNRSVVVESPLFNFNYNLCINCGRCVRMCRDVKGVFALGAVIHNSEFKIGTIDGPQLNNAECRFCGSCVEVCPTGAIMDKRRPRLMELKDLVPCKAGCPAEVDIPQYLRMVASGKNQEAAEIIASRLTFPSVLGKVCFHPCETNCRRNEIAGALGKDANAINIRRIKDYALVHSLVELPEKPKVKTGKRVSVVGSGPTGLTAAYLLSMKGHDVTIYEKENDLGGMLRYGIPGYRLPDEVLNKDLERLKESGFKVATNKCLGKDITVESLKESSDAVFLALGLNKSRKLNVPGENDTPLIYGIELLSNYKKNIISNDYFKTKSVAVIGGGNVANDVARTAIRLKAVSVTIICLEQYDEMPAYTNELIEAEDEGVSIKNGWGISEIHDLGNGSYNLNLKKCTKVFDNKGKFSPEYDDSVTESLNFEVVCISIGQQAGEEFLNDVSATSVLTRGFIKTNSGTLETSLHGVFAGGDIVSGPASVVDAVAAGRKAAREIDLFLGGDGIIDNDSKLNDDYDMHIGRKPGFWNSARLEGQITDSELRKQNFIPVEITYNHDEAVREASRCLQCDLRLKIGKNPLPPEKYLKFTNEFISKIPEKEGVVQLLDSNKNIFAVKGSDNIKKSLYEMTETVKDAVYFIYELDPMFTKRESELIQQFLQKHGKLPDSGDDLDDLF